MADQNGGPCRTAGSGVNRQPIVAMVTLPLTLKNAVAQLH
jgi:hypothetical protein